jgi:hypothetical protein
MIKTRNILLMYAAVLVFCLPIQSTQAALTGPVWPAPGGNSYSSSGAGMGESSGYTFAYYGFSTAAYSTLEWGPWDVNSIKLALDGNVNPPIISLSSFTANSAEGVGKSTISIASGNGYYPLSVETRFRVVLTDNNGGTTGISNDGTNGLFDVTSAIASTGGFKASLYAFARTPGAANWTPLNDFYDFYHTQPGGGDVITEFSGGFYYEQPPVATPEPTSILFIVLSILSIGTCGYFVKIKQHQ